MDQNFENLRQQRDELYQDARTHPDSEADQMVQILLLSALRNRQSADDDENLGAALARERHDYRQARAKRARERLEAQASRAAEDTLPDAEIDAETRGEAGSLSAEARLEKIAQALENMKAAESGKEMDAQAVYRRICDIVGLHSPLVPIGGDPEAEGRGFGA